MNLELHLGNRVANKMLERGVSEEEVRQSIVMGDISTGQNWEGQRRPAGSPRAIIGRERIILTKKSKSYIVVEPWATVVVTVITRYGFWKDAE